MIRFFTYGRWTDVNRMRQIVPHWEDCRKASLPDHAYTFGGLHPEYSGGSSMLIGLRGATTLGVAYQIDDRQLEIIAAQSQEFVIKEAEAVIDSTPVAVVMLESKAHVEPRMPSQDYLSQVEQGLLQHYPVTLVELYLAHALERAKAEPMILRKSPTPNSFGAEYGGDFRRLFPWDITKQSLFGSAWFIIRPGTESTPHNHDEEETFIFLSGEGIMSVDGREFPVGKGDTVYLQPFSAHTVRNTGNAPLELLCVWWGGTNQT